jgi:hypothetical protein
MGTPQLAPWKSGIGSQSRTIDSVIQQEIQTFVAKAATRAI